MEEISRKLAFCGGIREKGENRRVRPASPRGQTAGKEAKLERGKNCEQVLSLTFRRISANSPTFASGLLNPVRGVSRGIEAMTD